MIPLSEAVSKVSNIVQEIVIERSTNFGVDRVSFDRALGRIAAESVYSPWPVPICPTSIKDGYAIRSSSLRNDASCENGRIFTIIGQSYAGDGGVELSDTDSNDFTVCYVTTGSVIPDRFDAVIEVEKTIKRDDGTIEIVGLKETISPFDNIRLPGSDLLLGTCILTVGDVISATAIGMLTTFGHSEVSVFRKVRVAVLSTGDELIDAATCNETEKNMVLSGRRIFDTNRPVLMARMREVASSVVDILDLGILRDTHVHLENGSWLFDDRVQDADVLVVSGAVSIGERDFVRKALERAGKLHVEKIFMKPGKPLCFATVPRPKSEQPPQLVFGLPGNPVSSLVTFDLIVLPALRMLAGYTKTQQTRIRCELDQDFELDQIRPEFHRASVSSIAADRLRVRSTGFQRSSSLWSMSNAMVLLEMPDATSYGNSTMAKGSIVNAIPFGDWRLLSLEQPTHVVDVELWFQANTEKHNHEIEYSVEKIQGLRLVLKDYLKPGKTLLNAIERFCASSTSTLLIVFDPLRNGCRRYPTEDEIEAQFGLNKLARLPGLEEAMRASVPSNEYSAIDSNLAFGHSSGKVILYLFSPCCLEKKLLAIHAALA